MKKSISNEEFEKILKEVTPALAAMHTDLPDTSPERVNRFFKELESEGLFQPPQVPSTEDIEFINALFLFILEQGAVAAPSQGGTRGDEGVPQKAPAMGDPSSRYWWLSFAWRKMMPRLQSEGLAELVRQQEEGKSLEVYRLTEQGRAKAANYRSRRPDAHRIAIELLGLQSSE